MVLNMVDGNLALAEQKNTWPMCAGNSDLAITFTFSTKSTESTDGKGAYTTTTGQSRFVCKAGAGCDIRFDPIVPQVTKVSMTMHCIMPCTGDITSAACTGRCDTVRGAKDEAYGCMISGEHHARTGPCGGGRRKSGCSGFKMGVKNPVVRLEFQTGETTFEWGTTTSGYLRDMQKTLQAASSAMTDPTLLFRDAQTHLCPTVNGVSNTSKRFDQWLVPVDGQYRQTPTLEGALAAPVRFNITGGGGKHVEVEAIAYKKRKNFENHGHGSVGKEMICLTATGYNETCCVYKYLTEVAGTDADKRSAAALLKMW